MIRYDKDKDLIFGALDKDKINILMKKDVR